METCPFFLPFASLVRDQKPKCSRANRHWTPHSQVTSSWSPLEEEAVVAHWHCAERFSVCYAPGPTSKPMSQRDGEQALSKGAVSGGKGTALLVGIV